jgi:hypothetical protein
MPDLFIDTTKRVAVADAWNPNTIGALPARAGDSWPLNLYLLDTVRNRRAPYAIHRYAGASITAKLLDDSNTVLATQGSFSEIVPNWAAGNTPDATVTITIASPGVVTWTGHGFVVGQAVVFQTTGALPTGIIANQIYYVLAPTTNTFELGTAPGSNAGAINTSGSQSGTHTGIAISSVSRLVSGTNAIGEYDRINLAAEPGSGSYNLVLKGGTVTVKGQTSASSRIYPHLSTPIEAAGAFAGMNGQPWVVQFVDPVTTDVHGSAAVTGTSPYVQAVDVAQLGFLLGWSASLDLTPVAVGNAALFDGDTSGYITLAIILTPSGGAAQTVLKLPINLFS